MKSDHDEWRVPIITKKSQILWKEKEIQKKEWFVIHENSHEGPFSLSFLAKEIQNGRLKFEDKIWRKGMKTPLLLNSLIHSAHRDPLELLNQSDQSDQSDQSKVTPLRSAYSSIDSDVPPPLPKEFLTDFVQEKESRLQKVLPTKQSVKTLSISKRKVGASVFWFSLLALSFFFFNSPTTKLTIPRLSKMTLKLHERIKKEVIFEGHDASLGFKEYIAPDFSHVWLATSSFLQCDEVEGYFLSQNKKILHPLAQKNSISEERDIHFQSFSVLENHLIDFSKFQFAKGVRIIPGRYQLELTLRKCHHSHLPTRIKNVARKFLNGGASSFAHIVSADLLKEKKISLIVTLYPKGKKSFDLALKKYQKKKEKLELRQQKYGKVFWENITEKFKTLNALTANIEQHFLSFLENKNFKNMKGMKKEYQHLVQVYTRNFGPFLTSFFVNNEKSLTQSSSEGISYKIRFDHQVKTLSEKLGRESMIILESLEKSLSTNVKHAPSVMMFKKQFLDPLAKKVQRNFSEIEKKINQQISQALLIQESKKSFSN